MEEQGLQSSLKRAFNCESPDEYSEQSFKVRCDRGLNSSIESPWRNGNANIQPSPSTNEGGINFSKTNCEGTRMYNIGDFAPSHEVSQSYTTTSIISQDQNISTISFSDRFFVLSHIEEVCLGMICGVKGAFLNGFSLNRELFADVLGSKHSTPGLRFDIIYYSSCSKLRLVNTNATLPQCPHTELAVLDNRSTAILQELSKICKIKTQTYMDTNISTNSATGESILDLSIVLYCSADHAKIIGSKLSKAGFYLQHPIQKDPNTKYENPHFFKVSVQNDASQTVTSSSSADVVWDTEVSTPAPSVVDQVFESISHSQAVLGIDPDPRVTTPLLSHQKEALSFIESRERQNINNFSLWKAFPTESGTWYEHTITGERSEKTPESVHGGILADEMGLGKTLSMISAIITLTKGSTPLHPAVSQSTLTSGGTLILVPAAVLINGWLAEFRKHVAPSTVNICKYHGNDRHAQASQLLDYDVVITTYGTITSEYSKLSSPLHAITWYRVVLDEAHFIRNRTTQQFKAVSSIHSNNRWCLTATPVQNSLDDLGALVTFLQIPRLGDSYDFRRHIISPLKNPVSNPLENLRLLLGTICLRRTISLLNLPTGTYQTHILEFSRQERSHYDEILKESLDNVEKAVSNGSENAYTSILRGLVRLRMLCNYGTLQRMEDDTCSLASSTAISENLASLLEGDEEASMNNFPSLLQNTTTRRANHLQVPDRSVASGRSTKFTALVQNLLSISNQEKSIVFSCWRTTLDLLEPLLLARGIRYVRIDGNVSGNGRSAILSRFHSDPSISVILMTTGTGAVGLNLTVATQVHLLEPQWNPSIEAQAIGRVLRITQVKSVTVTRYIMKNTVEEFIQEKQKKKEDLAVLTMTKDMKSERQVCRRLENLRSLLR